MGRRFARIAIGVVLVLVGLAMLENAFLLTVILGGIGFMLLRRELDLTHLNLSNPLSSRDMMRARPPRRAPAGFDPFSASRAPIDDDEPVREGRAYEHAQEAARRAGIDLTDARVYPLDIGVMAFHEGDAPVVHRTAALAPEIDSVQPYLELYVPMRVEGTIRFEMRDSDGVVRFAHTVQRTLSRGANLITPPARLPIDAGMSLDGRWELRISANGIPIASHFLEWSARATSLIGQHLGADGEISPELTDLIAESQFAPLSLDELLSDQDSAEAQYVPRQSRRQRGGR